MTTAPLDKYIKSPPPADERSHFNYLEEQFSKLENVSNKHVVRIAENNESAKALVLQESNARVSGDEAQATYTLTVAAQTLNQASALVQQEATARTTADSALASSITTLQANVGTLSGAITNEASLRVTADEALGTRIDNLVLTSGNDAAVIIDEEASARITADVALGARIDSLTATVNTNTAAISTEQTTRATRDDALAQQLFTMSSGSSRVYINATAPGSTGRQPGDVWFDSDDSYKPYVWARSTPTATTGSYDWRDNSNGSFTNLVGNYAVYTQAISTLNTASSSQASSITALQTTVGDSTAGLVRDVGSLTTTVGNSSSGLVRDVSTLQSTTAQQRIFRQGTQPSTATADRKIGDLWFDTSNGNTPYYWNGSGWVANPDNTRATTAALSSESSARTTADSAVARSVVTASAGTGRVYTSDPGTASRLNGDVWIRVEENFTPYVWFNNTWNNNSSGQFTQYVGQIASVTQAASAAQNTANGLSYDWRVQGTIDGQPAGSIRLAGARRINQANGQTETVSRLVIDANAEINGSLLVNGSVGNNQLANSAVTTGKLADTAVTTSKITDEAITTAKLGAGSITSVKLADGSVTAAKMPDGVIVGTKIADGAITTQKIAANAITANLINAETITADKIVAKSITSGVIADNAVTTSGFATGNGSCSTTVTVRPGSRVQIIAVTKAALTVQQKEWYSTNDNGNNPQSFYDNQWNASHPPAPSTAVNSLGNLTINTPAGNEEAAILGGYNGSASDTLRPGKYFIRGRFEFGYYRNFNILAYATTAITSYLNNTNSPITHTFSASAAGVNTTVTLYVIELAK